MSTFDLDQVLLAREQRWYKRCELANQYDAAVVAATLCLPLRIRTTDQSKKILRMIISCLRTELDNNGNFAVAPPVFLDSFDGLAILCPVVGDAEDIKRFCVNFEQSHPAFRMMDIDITAPDGRSVCRADIGSPARKCFICDKPAAECVVAKAHDPDTVDEACIKLISLAKELF